MRFIVQKFRSATVRETQLGRGYVIFADITELDDAQAIPRAASRISGLRLWERWTRDARTSGYPALVMPSATSVNTSILTAALCACGVSARECSRDDPFCFANDGPSTFILEY